MVWSAEKNEKFKELYKQFPKSPMSIQKGLEAAGYACTLEAIKQKCQRVRRHARGEIDPRRRKRLEGKALPAPRLPIISKWLHIKPEVTKVLAIYDSHYPFHVDVEPLIRYARDFKPDIFVLGGDNWSLDCISHWNKDDLINEGRFTIRDRLLAEAKGFGAQLDSFRRAMPRTDFHYILGNHEYWLEDFERANPSFTRSEGLTIGHLLRLRDRDIRTIPFGGTLQIGKLYFKHGHEFGTQNPCKQALERTHRSVVFGHHHSYKVWQAFSMVDDAEKYVGIQVPCYCKMGPKYLKGRPNDWQNGFFTAMVKKSGNFTPYVTLVSPKGHFLTQDGKEYT